MNWIHIHDGLPESGEEVLVCSKLWEAMPACAENVSYGICTYCKVGDVLFNEKQHDPIDISDEDFWNSEVFSIFCWTRKKSLSSGKEFTPARLIPAASWYGDGLQPAMMV